MKNITVIGNLNADLVIGLNELPVFGQTVSGKTLDYFSGGKGANQAFASASLGGSTSMIGMVGHDANGASVITSLQNCGVNTDCIFQSQDHPTGTAVIFINDQGDNCIVVIDGANSTCNIDFVFSHMELLSKTDIFLLQQEIPRETNLALINWAFEMGKTIIMNPAPANEPFSDDFLQRIDYLTPNLTELEILSGQNVTSIESAMNAGKVLLRRGVSQLIVTLGEQGSLYMDSEQVIHKESLATVVIDTTAAGDTFNGALAVGLAEGMDMSEILLFANTASSLTVGRKGAQSSIPTRQEVNKVL